MPNDYDANTAAQWAAAAQIGSSAINYASAANSNRKGRKWAEKQYERERADALADWHMQNEYNSPAAQMARLKAGGLNPNLVYGDGANSPAATIRGADANWKPEAPGVDGHGIANTLMAAISLRQTEAQTNNLIKSGELIEAQKLLTTANTLNVGSSTARSQFDLEQLKQKAATDIEIQKANLRNLDLDAQQKGENIKYTHDNNERQALVNALTLQKGVEEVLNLRATRDNIRQQTLNAETQRDLMRLDQALKENGLQPHDPLWARMGKKAVELIPNPKQFKAWVDKTLQQLWKNIEDKGNNYRKSLISPGN